MARPDKMAGRALDLVGRIYDAALDNALWPHLAPAIADTFKSTSSFLSVADGAPKVLTMSENLVPGMSEYLAYYYQMDVNVECGTHVGLGKPFSVAELVSDRTLQESEFYVDWIQKQRTGVFYMGGTLVPIASGVVAWFGVHRPKSSGPYTAAEMNLISGMIPHMRRAFQIQRKLAGLATERGAHLDALARTRMATAVVDRTGRLLYANPRAEALLREADGLAAARGRLAAVERIPHERLAFLIRGAADIAAGIGKSSGGAIAIARRDRLPLSVLVAPFRPAREGFGAPLPAAILFIRDPEEPTLATDALQSLYGLTAAEARVASLLAQGRSVQEIATETTITLNTARTHLKRILEKTRTGRQAELVALLLRGGAVLDAK